MSYEKYQNVGMVKERYNENSSFQQQQQSPQSRKQMKVTFIDDLPELEDIENRPNSNEKTTNLYEIDDKFKKYIRSDATPHVESGMVDGIHPRQNQHRNMFLENNRVSVHNPPDVNYHYQIPSSDDGNLHHHCMHREQHPDKTHLSCIDIAEHVQNCPVCGKLYKNDNTMYMGIIAILVILCILLIKRVLEVPVEK
jgi:hypothetical protein